MKEKTQKTLFAVLIEDTPKAELDEDFFLLSEIAEMLKTQPLPAGLKVTSVSVLRRYYQGDTTKETTTK